MHVGHFYNRRIVILRLVHARRDRPHTHAAIDRSAGPGGRKVLGQFFSQGREAHGLWTNPEGTRIYIAHEQDELPNTPDAGQTVCSVFDVSDPFKPQFITQIALGDLTLPSGKLRNKKSINLIYVHPAQGDKQADTMLRKSTVILIVLVLASLVSSASDPRFAVAQHDHHRTDTANAWSKGNEFARALAAGMDKMHRDMTAPMPTGNADVDFLATMIPHHAGAVEMARLVLIHGKDLGRRLAEEIANQQADIMAMQAAANPANGR
jgi:uncharacterized protein (DUF305 family)